MVYFENPGNFNDDDSNPARQSYKYKISVLDICGNESGLSYPHATMHLTLNLGLNNGTNLIWSKYEGFSVESYNIWRGSSIDNMFLIGSVSGSNFTFTDQFPLAGTNTYQVEVVSPYSCNPDNLKALYSSSFSNITYRFPSDINNVTNHEFRVFPNPSKSNITIEFPNPEGSGYNLFIMDGTGRIVYQKSNITEDRIEFHRGNLPDGLYLVELRGPKVMRTRIILY